MTNLDELLSEAKWGKLSEEEINYVVEKIKATTPDDDEDLYKLIHILGKANAIQHRKLVESFLYYPTYPMISEIALQTLCDFWGYAKDYIPQLKAFVKGVSWDVDEDVRLLAIGSVGELLREVPDKELLELIIGIWENDQENEIMRECAIESLARATGRDYKEFLIIKGQKPPEDTIWERVIHDAFQMLENLKKTSDEKK